MERKLLASIGSEVDVIVRTRRVAEAEVCRRIIEFLDYEFHGVVPLPLDASQEQPEGRGLEE